MGARLQELLDRRMGGQHLAVVRLAEQLLVGRDGLTESEAVEAARSGIRSACHLGQYFQARWFADQERLLADASGEAERIGVAAYHQGYVALFIGDVTLAQEHLGTFFQCVSASPEKLHRYNGPAWFNFGASQLLQRQYDAAAESYGRARAAFGADAQTLKVAECDLQLAWASLMGGRVSPAAGYLEAAGSALALQPDADLHFSYLCHMALLALKTGRMDEAEEHCHQVLAPAQLGVTAHHRGEAAWVLGEVALCRTSLDQAKVHASRAMDEAIRCKWPGLMNLASELHQRIAQAKDRTA